MTRSRLACPVSTSPLSTSTLGISLRFATPTATGGSNTRSSVGTWATRSSSSIKSSRPSMSSIIARGTLGCPHRGRFQAWAKRRVSTWRRDH
ncbi:hypothetical protein ZIOFF_061205 [Zingiber officinale]|uniref:Uncharacterized protein n=1 Tax=Zingiber officinale TaxID=94328 RepID=A0A8J5F3Q4_ZINOF|nr:hypothetical protein ZIOFF_061205 [Zingiber officinale]